MGTGEASEAGFIELPRRGVHVTSTLTRRELLGSAILAGAGATVVQELARFDPAKAATNPDVDPNFLMGQVVQYDSGTGVFQVVDLDLQVRPAQLTSASQVWKQGLWNSAPLALNDCVMSRGTLNSQNTLLIGQLWVDIRNFRGQLTSVSSSSVTLTQGSGSSTSSASSITAVVNSQTQVNVAGQTVTGTTQGLAPGQYVNVIGYGEPSAGTLVATLIIGPAADLGSDPAPVVSGTGADCTFTTYKHLATWFCCGNVSSACGANCSGSGIGKLSCGHSVQVGNPCLNNFVFATVHDCGPCVHCRSPFGCDNRSSITFDLTPCLFTKIGGTLSSGIQTCDALACVS